MSFPIDNPHEFFELPASFTKKDLKRAYTKKIKKYKPEKFPEEFMQIRAAFERLEQELAYGKPESKTINIQSSEANDSESNLISLVEGLEKKLNVEIRITEDKESDSINDFKKTITELNSPAFDEIYKDLSSNNYLDISEKISASSETSIKEKILNLFILEKNSDIEGLIDGLIALYKENPEEPLIEQTLRYILREDLPLEIIEATVLQLASCLGGFYYNCELLLQKYLRESGFEKFIELLDRCELRLSFTEKRDSPVFYCRLIYRYFFRIDPKWRDEKIIVINESLSLDNDYLDEKLDFIDMLIAFTESLKDYPESAKNIKSDLINCIQTYQEVPGLQSEHRFYETMKTFRMENYLTDNLQMENPYIAPAFRILNMISEEYMDSRNIDDKAEDNNLCIYHFLQTLNSGKYDKIPRLMGIAMFLKALSKIIVFSAIAIWLFYCAMILFNSFGEQSDDATGMFVLALFVIIPLLTLRPYRMFWPKIEKYFDNFSVKMTLKQYERLRVPLTTFICKNIISEQELTNCINTYENSNIQCSYLQIGIGNDYAVSLAAIAAIHKF